MNREWFNEFLDEQWTQIAKLNTHKGHDYAGDDDVFANFDRAAEKYGITREMVLGVYLSKHLDAIDTYIKEGDVSSEPIQGRIHDAILYLLLLLGMTSPPSPLITAMRMVPIPDEATRGYRPDYYDVGPYGKTAP